jgi:hypothetical protein
MKLKPCLSIISQVILIIAIFVICVPSVIGNTSNNSTVNGEALRDLNKTPDIFYNTKDSSNLTINSNVSPATSTNSKYVGSMNGIPYRIPPSIPGENFTVQNGTLPKEAQELVEANVMTSIPGDVIYLYPGWNRISVPRTLADGQNTLGVVFASVDTAYHSVFGYNAATQSWIQMTSTSIIRPLDGFMIYSRYQTQIQLYYQNDPLQRVPIKPVYSGWNMIGFSRSTSETAHSTLLSVDNTWTQASGFDAQSQTEETQIIHGGTGIYSDLRLMNPTKGYWLYITPSRDTLIALGI